MYKFGYVCMSMGACLCRHVCMGECVYESVGEKKQDYGLESPKVPCSLPAPRALASLPLPGLPLSSGSLFSVLCEL